MDLVIGDAAAPCENVGLVFGTMRDLSIHEPHQMSGLREGDIAPRATACPQCGEAISRTVPPATKICGPTGIPSSANNVTIFTNAVGT